ncbi:major facilitator superfamily domain-containing protein [Coniella lustricola]|uniref:Major facilitator superfamily domain-containing protein n=1 Tax=Coniella lustricola TaxID=2025994 RepID=A0A2T3A4R6_9PEZI|nr:major facilitator superfamily domain-containing protein [Coniella lustricola]
MDETTPLLPDAATAILPGDDEHEGGSHASATTTTTTTSHALHHGGHAHASSSDIVDFDPAGDPDNPMDWPVAYKWGIVALLAAMAFTVTFTCISVVPIATNIVDDLEHSSRNRSGSAHYDTAAAAVLLVTIWELGEAAGPLLIAPLSELYGRYPVLNAANALFIVCTALTALSPTTSVIIAARALTGLAVASNVLAPAIVGDMFPSEQRGAAMSLIQLAPLTGGAVGPAIAGAIAESAGWRQCVWMGVALAVACEVAVVLFFRETYKVPILRNKAARLRLETGNEALRTAFDVRVDEHDRAIAAAASAESHGIFSTHSHQDEEDQESQTLLGNANNGNANNNNNNNKNSMEKKNKGAKHHHHNNSWALIWESIMRPAIVLQGSFVLLILSFYGSFLFSYFYVMSTTLPGVLQHQYHFSPAATGGAFIMFSLGSAIGVVFVNTLLDRIYIHLRDTANPNPNPDPNPNPPKGRPEYRLPLVILSSFIFPFTVLLYGWSVALHLPVAVLLLSLALMGTFLMLSFVPLMAYVVDAFGIYSASSITALIVTRCLMGTFLPLTAQPAIARFGFGWGMSLFAAISALTIPIPWSVYRYGHKWRQASQYTRD